MPLTPEEQAELQSLEQGFGNLSPQEIQELSQLENEVSDPTFMDRMGSTLQTASQKAVGFKQAKEAGQIGFPEYAYNMAGQVGVPTVSAPLGAAIGEAGEIISDIDKATGGYGRQAAQAVGQSGAGQAIGKGVKYIAEKAGQFAEQFPRTADIAESTLNLGAIGVPFAKYGDDVLENSFKSIKNLKPKDFKMLSSDDLREKGGQLFELAARKGGGTKPEFWDDYIKSAQRKITQQPDELWLKKLSEAGGESKALEKAVQALSTNVDDAKSFASIKRADEILGDLAESTVTPMGKYTREGKDFLILQQTLRDKISNASDDMFFGKGKEAFELNKQARKYYAASFRLSDVENILKKAEGKQQPSTIIKNGFMRLRDNPKKFKAYTPEEQFFIKKASKTGLTEETIKLAGSGLMPIVMTGVGGAGGSALGAAGIGGGAAGGFATGRLMQAGAKSVGEDMARRKGLTAAQSIVSSATGQQVPVVAPYVSGAALASGKVMAIPGAQEAIKQETMAERARRLFRTGVNK